MSALLRRVASAAAATPAAVPVNTPQLASQTDEVQADSADASDVLLPLSMVEQYLSQHPGLCISRTPTEDVHGAIVRLHAFCVSTVRPDVDTPLPPPQPTCPECKIGYQVIDAREGCVVCKRCGLVSRSGINVVAEYQAPPEVRNTRKRKHGVPGVPAWLLKKSQAVNPADRMYSNYWEELQSWNAYFNLPADDLKEADDMLRSWKATGGDTREARMVAVLIYIRMRHHMPNEDEVRKQLRCHQLLEAVDCGPPEPTYECQACGSKHHCKKGARFCCKTSWGRRTR